MVADGVYSGIGACGSRSSNWANRPSYRPDLSGSCSFREIDRRHGMKRRGMAVGMSTTRPH